MGFLCSTKLSFIKEIAQRSKGKIVYETQQRQYEFTIKGFQFVSNWSVWSSLKKKQLHTMSQNRTHLLTV